MDSTSIMQPLIQCGFAGLSAVLLGVLIWILKLFLATVNAQNDSLVAITKETAEEIAKNTAAIAGSFDKIHEVHERQLHTLEQMHQELLKRPRIAKDD